MYGCIPHVWYFKITMELLFGLQPLLEVEVELLYAGGQLLDRLCRRGPHDRLDLVDDHLDLSRHVGHARLVQPPVEELGELLADGSHFRRGGRGGRGGAGLASRFGGR